MAYTPTTWTTGDTITASAMNKIENGIADASFAVVTLSATGFSSSSKTFGYLVYARLINNNWVVITDNDSNWWLIFGFAEPDYQTLPPHLTMVSSEVCPFIVSVNADEIVTTGGISDTAETIYWGYGSQINGGGYRISGSGSIQFVAL